MFKLGEEFTAQVNEVCPEKKLDDITEKARDAFWAVIAESFPEVKTGDYPPDVTLQHEEDCKYAVMWWLIFNHPGIKIE
jgi:hypothetical protein